MSRLSPSRQGGVPTGVSALLALADPLTAGPIAHAVQRVGLVSMLAFDAEQVRARLRDQSQEIAVVLLDTQLTPATDDELVNAIRNHTRASILTLHPGSGTAERNGQNGHTDHTDHTDQAGQVDQAGRTGPDGQTDHTGRVDQGGNHDRDCADGAGGLPLDAPVESIAARAHALAQAGWANPIPLTLRWGDLRLDPVLQRCSVGRDVLNLTSSQFAVLAALIRAAGTAVSVEEIAEAIYGRGHPLDSQRVRAHIVRLRRAVRTVRPQVADMLITVRGQGYRLLLPDELR